MYAPGKDGSNWTTAVGQLKHYSLYDFHGAIHRSRVVEGPKILKVVYTRLWGMGMMGYVSIRL